MTDQKINVAIAEACGWEFEPSRDVNGKARPEAWVSPNGERIWTDNPIPDYANDLNAMRDAEMTFDGQSKAFFYFDEIRATILRHAGLSLNGCVGNFRFLTAPARIRAEAFLRTIGKWEE